MLKRAPSTNRTTSMGYLPDDALAPESLQRFASGPDPALPP